MNFAQKGMWGAVGFFLLIALVTITVNIFSSSTEATKAAQGEFASVQTELSSQAYEGYENTTLTGNQVMNAIRKFNNKSTFGIQVYTGKNIKGAGNASWYINQMTLNPGSATHGTTLGSATATLANAVDETSDNYINPSGQFQGVLIRDSNNNVRGIIFQQKK